MLAAWLSRPILWDSGLGPCGAALIQAKHAIVQPSSGDASAGFLAGEILTCNHCCWQGLVWSLRPGWTSELFHTADKPTGLMSAADTQAHYTEGSPSLGSEAVISAKQARFHIGMLRRYLVQAAIRKGLGGGVLS